MNNMLTVFILIFLVFATDFNSYCQDDKFVIVYNNMADETELESDWGYAAWIELDGKVYLFDSGAKGDILVSNLQKLNLDPSNVDKVIISHTHYDHLGGLPAIAKSLKPNTIVYIPEEIGDDMMQLLGNLDLRIETNYIKIAEDLWITEVLVNPDNRIKEHALVLENNDKFIVITGCAHPGIITICNSVVNHFEGKTPELVTGGFHLIATGDQQVKEISDKLKKLGFEKAGASHCTGNRAIAIFKEEWGEDYVQLFLGDKYIF